MKKMGFVGVLLICLILVLFPGTMTWGKGENPSPSDPSSSTEDFLVFLPLSIHHGTGNPPPPANRLIVDHYAIDQFNQIPDNYILAASNIHLLFRHASVGNNINDGLDCLMNKILPRPSRCDSGLTPDQIFYDPKYNRNYWTFEFHAPPPGINPGWWDKVNFFIDRVDHPGQGENYDAVGFKFGYVDGSPDSNIDDEFFNVPNNTYPSIQDLQELEARHPDKILIYWTIGLAKGIGTADSESFNQQMRSFAIANDKVLMDIADIESHRPDGSACFDIYGRGIEAMCDEYTDEVVAGHLNALGRQRMAEAMWILMARLAGWDGSIQ